MFVELAVTGTEFAVSVLLIVVGALVTTVLAGLVGQALTYRWDDAKRQRESDLAARQDFYAAYAKWFTTWKLWNQYVKRHHPGFPADAQWTLVVEAEDAEGRFEALLVRLASERHLSKDDRHLLASFRQGYQALREQIRDGKSLDWYANDFGRHHDGFRSYRAFKALSARVAELLAEDRPRPRFTSALFRREPTAKRAHPSDSPQPVQALLAVTRVKRSEDWRAVAEGSKRLGLGPPPQRRGESVPATGATV